MKSTNNKTWGLINPFKVGHSLYLSSLCDQHVFLFFLLLFPLSQIVSDSLKSINNKIKTEYYYKIHMDIKGSQTLKCHMVHVLLLHFRLLIIEVRIYKN